MKEIVLWEQMCCISSCVLSKHTNTGVHRSTVPKTTPGFGQLGSECVRTVKGRRRRRKGLSQLGCTNSRSPLWSFLAAPWRAQPIFINGAVHTLEHGEERAVCCGCQNPQLEWCQSLGCSLLLNQDSQSWTFSSWSLCGTNQCGLGDRAGLLSRACSQ